MNPFEVDHNTIMVGLEALGLRLDYLRRWGWGAHVYQVIADLLDGLPGEVPASEIEKRMEALPDLIPGLPVSRWAMICETMLPEIYKDPPAGKKNSGSIPGSRSRLWRLAERARTGLSLHHPRDSHGVEREAPKQMTLF